MACKLTLRLHYLGSIIAFIGFHFYFYTYTYELY